MWQGDSKWANAIEKNGVDRLALCRVSTNLQLEKNTVSAKLSKANTMKRGVPAHGPG